MKKLINGLLLSGLFIFLIFSCKTKTVEPDISTLYEVKTDEFIKAEIEGKQFDYRTVLKTDYQDALKVGSTTTMFECVGCNNFMSIAFVRKEPCPTPCGWGMAIETIIANLLVQENTPVFYIGFRLGEKIDESNYRNIYTARTSNNSPNDWGDRMGDMIVKITSNENGKVSGTFSGKNLDGKEIKNGSFSLRYKL
jgi:hypothetical protein